MCDVRDSPRSPSTLPARAILWPVKTMRELQSTLPRPGRVERLLVREARRGRVLDLTEAEAVEGRGLRGDHIAERERPLSGAGAARQVTLIQAEHLPVVAALAGLDSLDAGVLRRNLVVSGVNVLALRERRFRVGEAVLEGTGPCHPCSRMEEELGEGGYNAVRGHGGITARVVKGGVIRVGDAVVPL